MKRKPINLPPHPNWRDPNMPVIGKSGREIDHHKMEIKAQLAMVCSTEPNWRSDPTYNMKRKPK